LIIVIDEYLWIALVCILIRLVQILYGENRFWLKVIKEEYQINPLDRSNFPKSQHKISRFQNTMLSLIMTPLTVSFYKLIGIERWLGGAKHWRPLQDWEHFSSLALSTNMLALSTRFYVANDVERSDALFCMFFIIWLLFSVLWLIWSMFVVFIMMNWLEVVVVSMYDEVWRISREILSDGIFSVCLDIGDV